MTGLGPFLLALVTAFGCALAARVLGWRVHSDRAAWVAWCSVPAILSCVLLVPADEVKLRAVAAFLVVDWAFKVLDSSRPRGPSDFGEYLRFLVPFPPLAVVYPDHRRRLARPIATWPQVARLGLGTIGMIVGFSAIRASRDLDVLRSQPALDHAVMLIFFVLATESASRLSNALERLAGFDTIPLIRNAYLSRTVAEFWQRYNYRVHDWLFRHVFVPSGGRREPVRATWMVLLASGVFHELMFGMATSVFDGSQLLFFLLQAPAAMASGRIERLARRGGVAGKVVAHGTTILYMYATSFLFFRGMGRVFPRLWSRGGLS